MGRRSRKRGGGGAARAAERPVRTPRPVPPPTRPRRPITASRDERPRAPWHPVPVTEVAIFAGGIAMIVGFVGGRNTLVVSLVGLAVCGLAVLELAAREHFAGFRSHALLLALAPVVALEAVLYAFGLSGPFLLAVAAPTYIGLAWTLRQRYKEAR